MTLLSNTLRELATVFVHEKLAENEIDFLYFYWNNSWSYTEYLNDLIINQLGAK